VSDIVTGAVDSLKALDLEWPIREATSSSWFIVPDRPSSIVAPNQNSKKENRRRPQVGRHRSAPLRLACARAVANSTNGVVDFCNKIGQ
jgi:hypothetical protein